MSPLATFRLVFCFLSLFLSLSPCITTQRSFRDQKRRPVDGVLTWSVFLSRSMLLLSIFDTNYDGVVLTLRYARWGTETDYGQMGQRKGLHCHRSGGSVQRGLTYCRSVCTLITFTSVLPCNNSM